LLKGGQKGDETKREKTIKVRRRNRTCTKSPDSFRDKTEREEGGTPKGRSNSRPLNMERAGKKGGLREEKIKIRKGVQNKTKLKKKNETGQFTSLERGAHKHLRKAEWIRQWGKSLERSHNNRKGVMDGGGGEKKGKKKKRGEFKQTRKPQKKKIGEPKKGDRAKVLEGGGNPVLGTNPEKNEKGGMGLRTTN